MITIEEITDVLKMQEAYKDLQNSGCLTKRNMCALCIPFRDKYSLKDSDTLLIAREQISLSGIKVLLEDK